MKKLFSVLFVISLILSARVEAVSGISGKPIYPYVNPTKQTDISIVYSIVGDTFLFLTLGVPAAELTKENLNSVALRLYNKKTQNYISPWMPYYLATKPSTISGVYSIQLMLANKAIVEAVVTNMQDLVLLISVNQSVNQGATHYLDFSPLCEKYPNNFVEAVTEKFGCH